MADAFGRVARVHLRQQRPGVYFGPGVNSVVVEGLHVSFTVVRSNRGEPNTCVVKIYNLAPTTRAQITRPMTVVLEAGYRDSVRRVFQGDLRRALHEKTRPQVVTTLELADGDRAWRGASFRKSYRGGTRALEVIRDCALATGLQLPANLTSDPELAAAQLAGGYAGDGGALQQLNELLALYGYRASVQDGVLQALRDGEVRPGEALVVSAATGLTGSPKINPAKGKQPTMVTFRKLLDPSLYPGTRIKLVSSEIEGFYALRKTTLEGDTRSGPWHTTCEATPLG